MTVEDVDRVCAATAEIIAANTASTATV
jgi:hypothetical protein